MSRIIYWFRNDLRLLDNEGFQTAAATASEIIPVYVFDPRQFARTKFGFRRAGASRVHFLLETVAALRTSLRERGGDLLIRIGEPEKIIAELAENFGVEYVFTSKEIAPDETLVESSLSKNLKVNNVDIRLFWMNTVVGAAQLPFPIAKLPDQFETFFSLVSERVTLGPLFPVPNEVNLPIEYTAGVLPSLPMLGIDPNEIAGATSSLLKPAGEALATLKLSDFTAHNGLIHQEVSADPLMQAQLSQWISIGCLSPRLILSQLEGKDGYQSTLRCVLKRDYHHWTLLRYGSRLFKPSGIDHNMARLWNNDLEAFDAWRNAATQNPEVNLVMHKLNQTGYLTFEERNLAAGFLANDLNINWTWGAMYFESLLIDYNVSNSWCNWNRVAGVAGNVHVKGY